jgi:hypothetical protein
MGGRLRALKHILKHEPRFERFNTLWILNKIIDENALAQLTAALKEYKSHVITIHFNPVAYAKCKTHTQRLHAAIGINAARNLGIHVGHDKHKWAMVMDGDCFFDAKGFNEFREGVQEDQQKNPWREYYTCPMIRTRYDAKTDEIIHVGGKTEAHPMFRKGSLIRFDEMLPFGQSEKQMLLRQLGHNVLGYNNQAKLTKAALCRSFGYCQHLATGPADAETSLNRRMDLRNESVENHLIKLDRLHRHGGLEDDRKRTKGTKA